MTDFEVIKTLATLKNASENFEGLRQYTTQCCKFVESMQSTVLTKIAKGEDLTDGESLNTVRNVLTESVETLMRKIRSAVDSLNGIARPGVFPIGIQLSLLDEIPPDIQMTESVYDPARRIVHRSGMIQPPASNEVFEELN
jgi:hypothetical protein